MFSTEIHDAISSYVYRLIDPRNGETFYVGVGIGNRVFDHVKNALDEADLSEDENQDLKSTRIRDIISSRFEVQHIIHRHGMDPKTAREVESALIDAYPGLSNSIRGHGGSEKGVMHAREVEEKYKAEEAPVDEFNLVEIVINRSVKEISIYDAVRWAWRMDKSNAERAEYVLAVDRGIIIGVFEPLEWLSATTENFPEFSTDETRVGRIGFKGKEADLKVQKKFLGKRVPKRKKGQANPVRYFYD